MLDKCNYIWYDTINLRQGKYDDDRQAEVRKSN